MRGRRSSSRIIRRNERAVSFPVISYQPDMHALWIEIAHRAGLDLTDKQHQLLSRYIDLLLHANQRMNLTRIDTRESAELLHVADALTLLAHLPVGQLQLADVGSGGGIPGIPLAMM